MSDGPMLPRRSFLKLGGGAAMAAMGGSLLAACGGDGGGGAQQSGNTTLRIAVATDPQTVDPAFGQAARANETIKNTYAQWLRYQAVDAGDGLLKADITKFTGEAAASYEVDPDHTRVTFTVRDAKFSGGNPMTADDFLYTVERAFGTKAGTQFVFNTIGVTDAKQATKNGQRQVVLELANPSPILEPLLRDQDAGIVDAAVVKSHATSDDPWAQQWMARNVAGGGAYMVGEYVAGQRLVLNANPNYWGPPKPFFTTVLLQVVPSADDRVLLLRNGSVDIAEDLSIDAASRLQDAAGVRVQSLASRNQNMFGLMNSRRPFDDVRVRRAIAYAIPYDALVKDVLHGQASVPKGIWAQSSEWFQGAPWPYKQDVAQAKALLAEAGHEDGFTFTCEVSDADGDAEAMAVPVKTALQQIGVTMNISKQAAAVFQKHLFDRSMQAWIQTGLGAYVDDPYYHLFLWYSSEAVINWTRFSNPTIDKITSQLKTELDVERRKSLAAQAQQVLNQELPIVNLAEPNFVLPMRDDISGFLVEPDYLPTYSYLKRT